MSHLPGSLQTFVDALRDNHRPSNVVDILLIALVIYAALVWLRGTTGMTLVKGAAFVIGAGVLLGTLLNLTVVTWLLQNSIPAVLIGIPIIFQPEIRRGLERLGRTRVASRRPRRASDQVLADLGSAATDMSRVRTGALIVVERETGLDDYMRTGTLTDAAPSVPLIVNVFWRNSPLHDGAMILRDNRVAAAGCTLPLSEAHIDSHYGTRHRAALGLSERTDAVVLVVSEETGDITIAVNGAFITHLDGDRLRSTLASLTDGHATAPQRLVDGVSGALRHSERPSERPSDDGREPAGDPARPLSR